MQIKDIMTRSPEVVTPNTSVQGAAQKMGSLDVGVMPVCDGNRLVGMITDRDIAVRATAEAMDPDQMKVSDAMTDHVHFCYADQSVEEAAQLMEKHQIRRLPVMERDSNELVGIVSLGDLAVDVEDSQLPAEALEEISKPSEPKR